MKKLAVIIALISLTLLYGGLVFFSMLFLDSSKPPSLRDFYIWLLGIWAFAGLLGIWLLVLFNNFNNKFRKNLTITLITLGIVAALTVSLSTITAWKFDLKFNWITVTFGWGLLSLTIGTIWLAKKKNLLPQDKKKLTKFFTGIAIAVCASILFVYWKNF